jgi:bifunctional non-homologous end joining protein LigD
MQEFGLESFVKTTGGKGLHVVIPISRAYSWDPIKEFTHAIADSMQHDSPKLYISKSSKAGRSGKIFVDYLRNDLTSTAIASFSARAREGATVAMPIAWSELKAGFDPKKFTIETVPELLKKRKKDPWEDYSKIKQKISASHLKALKIKI